MSSQRGFTLIELLVVISIISLLSSIVLASLNSARRKGDDAFIQSERRQVILALELYYDNNGAYPGPGAGFYCIGGTDCIIGVAGSNIAVTTQLPGLNMNNFTTATIKTSYGNNKGIVYFVPTNSNCLNGKCPVATSANDVTAARIISTTNDGGTVEQKVGPWITQSSAVPLGGS